MHAFFNQNGILSITLGKFLIYMFLQIYYELSGLAGTFLDATDSLLALVGPKDFTCN